MRMLRRPLSVLLLAAALVSCGDGQETASASPQLTVESLRARALAVVAQAVAPEEAARQLMDFGEAQYPQFFPSRQPTQSLPPFAYRHYPQTGTYLGVAVTAGLGYEYLGVYVMGGPFGNEPQFVGPLAQFISPVPPAEAASIARHPTDLVVNPGQAAELSVVADGRNLGYQWFRNGQAVPGAISSQLRIDAAAAADGGGYRVLVSQGAAQVFSNEAMLLVRAVPEAADDLIGKNLCLTCHLRDHRTAIGPGIALLAERYSGQHELAALLVQRIRKEGAGSGPLIAGHAQVRLTEMEAGLIAKWLIAGAPEAAVRPKPVLTPANPVVDEGGYVVFTAALSGSTEIVSYQWRRDGLDLEGERQATLTISGARAAAHAGTYTVVVRNGAGSASVSTTLRVVDPAAYPSEVVSIVVPVAAGGAMDAIARALAATLSDQVRGLAVNVVNVSGSGGLPALERVLSTQANGYTLLLTDARIATAPALYPERSIDPLRDLEPLGMLAQMPYVLLGGMHMPDGGAAELAAAWRVRATPPTFAHVGTGDLSQLCALALADAVGLPIVMKAYQGTSVIGVEMIDRSVDLACLSAPTLSAQVERRQVRAYAVTGMERSIVPALLGVETLDRSGLSGFDVANGYGLYVRRGTSPVVLQRLHQALAAARTQPYFMNQLAQHGLHPAPVTLATPAGHRAQLSIDLDRWRALIDRHGLRGS